MQRLHGFCKAQGKEYDVYIDKIPCDTSEDKEPKYIYGRTKCEYLKNGGNCDGKCSILKQNGIDR